MKQSKNLQVIVQLYELGIKNSWFTNRHINKLNLYQGQPRMLKLLWEHDGLTHKEIREKLEISQSSVVKTIERLKKKDILFTKADTSNKRAIKVYLTPKGYALQDELTPVFENIADKMLKDFTSQEKDEFIDYMKRVQKNIKESRDI